MAKSHQERARLADGLRWPGAINMLAAGLACLWLLLVSATLTPQTDDFKQYWQAAVNLWATGDPFVPPPDQAARAHQGYYYLPIFAYLVQPLAALDQSAGQRLWFWLNSVASVAFVLLCIRLSGAELARRSWGLVLLAFLLSPPARLNLQLGQVSALIALLLLGCFALAVRRPALAGLLLSLATLIRIFPALLGLPLLLWGRLRTVLWCCGWTVGLVALSLAVYGPGPYLSFVQAAQRPTVAYPFAAEHNLSFYGLFTRLFVVTPYSAAPLAELPWLVAPLTALCALATLALCVWRGRAEQGLLGFGLWLCGMMLLSSTNGSYTLVLLLIPLLAALRRLEGASDRGPLLALALCTALALVPPGWSRVSQELYTFTHSGWGLLLLTPGVYGLIGYVALLAWLAGRPGEASGAA